MIDIMFQYHPKKTRFIKLELENEMSKELKRYESEQVYFTGFTKGWRTKIGIDALYLAKPYSSIGKILINTLKYWKEVKDVEFVLFGTENQYIEKYKNSFKVITIPTKNVVKFYRELNKKAKKEKVDILFFPFDIAPFYSYEYAVMVHDLIFMYFTNNIKDIFFHFLVRSAIKRAKKIITPSEFIKGEIIKKYRISSDKIKVFYFGTDPTFRKIPFSEAINKINDLNILPDKVLNKGFILHVGRVKPNYKNLSTLLKAYIKCKDTLNKSLVIVSSDYPSFMNKKIIEKHKNDIVHIRNIPDEVLVLLYNLSDFFIFHSLSEGFGMGLLEAMACEKPIIASNIPIFREVLGNAGLFFNPFNAEELCKVMVELSLNNSLNKELSIKAKERAKIFTWERFSKGLLEELV